MRFPSISLHERKDYGGWMVGIMKDCIRGRDRGCRLPGRFTQIEIAIEARKITAADLEAQLMAG
jgi:hypothetical protein